MQLHLDRITEAYEGSMGPGLQQSSRDRIHWMIQSAEGRRVLDVGCSQGIGTILLAREGTHAIGIDIAQESIDFANDYLSRESAETRANTSFVCADFLTHDFADENFDTIMMCEVLEHSTSPGRFLERSASLLKEGGRMVISVPFGINDFPDHKRTYYFTDIYDTVRQFFVITDMRYMNGWLGLIATNRRDVTPIELSVETFREVERYFYSLNRRLLDSYDAQRSETRQLNHDLRTKHAESVRLIQANTELLSQLTGAKSLFEQTRSLIFTMQYDLSKQGKKLREAEATVSRLTEDRLWKCFARVCKAHLKRFLRHRGIGRVLRALYRRVKKAG